MDKFKYIIYDSEGLVTYSSMLEYNSYNTAKFIARTQIKIGKLAGYNYHYFSVI